MCHPSRCEARPGYLGLSATNPGTRADATLVDRVAARFQGRSELAEKLNAPTVESAPPASSYASAQSWTRARGRSLAVERASRPH